MDEILSNILKEYNKSQKLIEKFAKNGELPRIEFDILMSNLQYIYDALYHFKTNTAKPSQQEYTEIVSDNTLKQEKHDEQIKENKDFFELSAVPEVEKAQTTELFSKISVKGQKEKGEILAEKFKQEQPLINEILVKGQQKKDMSTLMQSKPVQSIESAIGINEKFVFTRELFNGDTDAFAKTIHILNNSANFNEAFNYMHQTYSWNFDSPTVQKLLDIVRRKFIQGNE